MAKRSKKSASLSSARAVVESLFSHLGIADKIEQHRVWLIWEECVGPQIAAQASPLRIRDNILEVRVSHPVWMQQLQLLKPRLLERLNAQLGETPLSDMFFRRGHRVQPEQAAPPKIVLPELSDREQEEIEQLVATISDPETRKAMQQLLTKQRQLDNYRHSS
ncbi:MAG: hypothetical protein C0620_12815 [Desulfuromonas sp.]|nr:MAG: hypothetical protein C0620_12815 [Desulfuromonas sp.]